jgi:molecular chaperone DnaK
MDRTTIDFGIDLGTTNSAIARLKGVTPEVIKNNVDADITPSAVYIDKRSQVHVGLRAKGRMETPATYDDVYTEFKRRMGTDHQYAFKSSGRTLTPEEVSAEVLKSLKGDAAQRLGEDIRAVVITIPAAFEQRQCAATKRAGELAGIQQCPLLQEPVAAALAYGFQTETKRAYWLVFDFGGGTFDAALMKADDGDIHVINHGGDNYLGGADLDWIIVEQLVLPELQKGHNLPGIKRGAPRWRAELAKVKRAVEEAKIALSRSDTAYLEGCQFADADGNEIEVEFKLTRDAVATLAEPLVIRATDICKRVLKEKNLPLTAVERAILVGGPTLAPYFRDMLGTHLGIPLDFSVDPLTVVARGAAVFAGTQRIDRAMRERARVGQFDVTLNYTPVGPDEDPAVSGEITSPDQTDLTGFAIEFVNRSTQWRSGRLPVKEDGRFRTRLMAQRGEENVFDIELTDGEGTRQKTVPSQLSYRIGTTVKEQIVTNSMAIALADNACTVMVPKGEPYPFRKVNRDFRTTKALAKGSNETICIPVIEGENPKGDCNVKLGELVIDAKKVKRDVPVGSEIEVKLAAKEPGSITVTAYIPLLDEEFEGEVRFEGRTVSKTDLEKERTKEAKRCAAFLAQATSTSSQTQSAVAKITQDLQTLDSLIAASGDKDAAKQAEKRILEIRADIDRLEDVKAWPKMVTKIRKAMDDMDRLVNEHGVAAQKQRAQELRKLAEELISHQNADLLRKHEDKVLGLTHDVLFAQPGFWVGFFEHLIEERAKMRDGGLATQLIEQGRQYIQRGNLDGLRHTVVRMLDLLPREIAEEIQRGYGSGVTQK